MVIDAHVHVDEVPALGWSLSIDATLAYMDRVGIDQSVIMSITDAPAINPGALEMIAGCMSAHPGRFVGYARMHPWAPEAPALLEHALVDLGFAGLKLHPVSTLTHPGDSATTELIRIAARHGAPTLFHCADEPLSTPLEIEEAARACPDATIVLAHMGGYLHCEDAIRVAERNDNVMLETSGVPYPAVIAEAVRRVGAERIIWGSDGPGCSPALEARKLEMLELPRRQERRILGANQAKLLGLGKA